MPANRQGWTACAAVAAIAAGICAGCGSGGTPASSGGHASPRPPASKQPSEAGPTATRTPRPLSAAQAAEAVQGPAAVPTAVQLAALRVQASEIARLSPQQMAGQRVIYSYRGLTVPGWLLADVRHGLVGGVIFFSFNISSESQIRRSIHELVAANDATSNPARRYPLLLMTDQEGGLVRRLPGAPFESQAQIGAAANPAAAAAAAGSSAAANLRGVGMNVNLAPVLDVFRAAGDFDDQFQRSYSMNPDVVGVAGAAFVRAQQAGGVAATLKHFPGLGAAGRSQNTDNGKVMIGLSAQALRTIDEAPYRPALKAGAKLAMVSWANYPALDPRLPAGLSPRIVQGDLERRLGFDGVTITDALGAGALAPFGGLGNKTMLAARAGMVALLCTATTPLPGGRCVAGLEQGLRDKALPRRAFEAQLALLLELRSSLRR